LSDERRSALRFPFEADAEVAPESTPKATISARVTQIGLAGCYMETPAPFAPQTPVMVKIFVPGAYFEAKATVIHVQPTSGMGLSFRDIKPNFRVILRAWLLDAMREEDPKAGWQ
jgi:PilZ domain-containing protein